MVIYLALLPLLFSCLSSSFSSFVHFLSQLVLLLLFPLFPYTTLFRSSARRCPCALLWYRHLELCRRRDDARRRSVRDRSAGFGPAAAQYRVEIGRAHV